MIFFLPGFLQSSLEFILYSRVSVLQKNRMNRVCVCVCVCVCINIQKEIYYKELIHTIMVAEKSPRCVVFKLETQ